MTLVTTYKATNQKNGKWYVGSTTTSLGRRKREHLNSSAHLPFHNALRKDPTAFVWEVLDETEEEVVTRSHEQYVLDGWWGTEYCYNVNPKATGCTSEQASERMRSQREDPEFVAAVGAAVSERNKKKWEDDDYRSFMSEVVKKKWEEDGYKEYRSGLSKETVSRLWEDEGYRLKQKAGMSKYWESEENRRKASERNRQTNTQKKKV